MDTKKNTTASETQPSSMPVMQSFNSPKKGPSGVVVLVVVLLMLVLGVGTGYAVAKGTGSSGTSMMPAGLGSLGVQKGQTFGSDDKAFKDTAEGVLRVGGIDDEGQFHLERPGGDSQNVYLTSSSVDLAKFVGRKIKVWGATQSAKKAGWLMDVGKVEVE